MDVHVTDTITNCLTCQIADKSAKTRMAPMQPVQLPERPWQKHGIDFVGPNYSAPANERYIISLIDYRSKWPEVAFCPNITAKTVIYFLTKVFSRDGYPEELVSDNGTQLTGQEFETFLKKRNIKHRFSVMYHPEGNSTVERFNRILNETIQTARIYKRPVKNAVTELIALRDMPRASYVDFVRYHWSDNIA
ncbi:uncharacterized protein K02A2.6-like [Anneissia japonica]|uniref:uncharacterized protein K02A2.6-like n=1 Tax=Anneissia japonica TaxID=1529436 RepID=UPI0014254BBA|nr:uncharacterized protein K02A2.6-like [Anneissia japonica]